MRLPLLPLLAAFLIFLTVFLLVLAFLAALAVALTTAFLTAAAVAFLESPFLAAEALAFSVALAPALATALATTLAITFLTALVFGMVFLVGLPIRIRFSNMAVFLSLQMMLFLPFLALHLELRVLLNLLSLLRKEIILPLKHALLPLQLPLNFLAIAFFLP